MLAYIQERNALRKLNENNKNSNKNQNSLLPTINDQKIVEESKKETVQISPKKEEVIVKEVPSWRKPTSLNTNFSLTKKEEVKETTKKTEVLIVKKNYESEETTEDLNDIEDYESENWYHETWDRNVSTTTYSGLNEKTNEDIQKVLFEDHKKYEENKRKMEIEKEILIKKFTVITSNKYVEYKCMNFMLYDENEIPTNFNKNKFDSNNSSRYNSRKTSAESNENVNWEKMFIK